ncbi:MAG: hypothetical protein Q8O67_10550 [Deltaproteobacteria bacterium]|nr:hypothetical protein [Deltaproteobacteria bacterium]
MEKNTFVASAYIDAPHADVLGYLGDLQNLNEWTLSSRMKEKIDASTWRGTASGYHSDLFYHLEHIDAGGITGVEWHCGYEAGNYHQVYPVLTFKPEYIDDENTETGTYLQWISFFDPKKSTKMLVEGVDVVHTSECRSLKARLERRAGHRAPRAGRHRVSSSTIYVDAAAADVIDFVADARTMGRWSHLLKHIEGDGTSAEFVDEYERHLLVLHRVTRSPRCSFVEQELRYGDGVVERSPFVVIPCAVALGDPTARGCFLHRVIFWRDDGPPTHGRLSDHDFGAELINIKRMCEAAAGHLETFARGCSYQP